MNQDNPAPPPSLSSYHILLTAWILAHAKDPGFPAALATVKEALLILWHLDLQPAEEILKNCYAPSPRGGDPHLPSALLRSLFLAHLMGYPDIHDWVDQLTRSPLLCAISGFFDRKRAGVGTFYDFLHRLHDGYVAPGLRECKPSEIQRARSKEARPVPPKPPVPPGEEEPEPKPGKKGKKAKEKKPKKPKAEPRWTVDKAMEKVKQLFNQARPVDLDRRMTDMLWKIGVTPSIERGLIPKELTLAGDGSPLPTRAWGLGTRVCEHSYHTRCDCPRRFSDPDADRGYDSYRKMFFFGYKFYEVIDPASGLPLSVSLNPASCTDHYAAPVLLNYLEKTNKAYGDPLNFTHFIADSGHDAEPFSRWLLERGVQPVIALGAQVPEVHPKRPDLALSDRAIPLCEAGVEMASWGTGGPGRPMFVCPVKAGKLEKCPKAPPEDPGWVCRPDKDLAPMVVLKSDDNPRLFPPISRNSAAYAKLYATRTSCERSNARKKQGYELLACGHRRSSFWKIRLTLMAILQHASARVKGLSADDLMNRLLTGQSG